MALDAMRRLVATARDGDAAHFEVELRIGSMDEGDFVPGVPRAVFEEFHDDLERCLVPDPDGWVELVDYFYTTQRHQQARTRVTFDRYKLELGRVHVVKTKEASLRLQLADDDGSAVCRLALNREVPLEHPPETCIPTHVRVQQRRRFCQRGHHAWAYELSRTWSASSRSAVEQKQHSAEPVYEIECELVDLDYLRTHTDDHVARSLHSKALMLLGSEADADDRGDDPLAVTVETVRPSLASSVSSSHKRCRRR